MQPLMMLLAGLAAALALRTPPASAEPRAPEPGQPLAQSPPQLAAQAMIRLYGDFCLNRFPDLRAVQAGAARQQMVQETQDQAERILLGRSGMAWRVASPAGVELAIETGERQGCAVSGQVADDAASRAAFDQVVTGFAAGHPVGTLTRPPLQTGLVEKAPAALQIIGADHPRQAFVNMATGAGEMQRVRMTREIAPK